MDPRALRSIALGGLLVAVSAVSLPAPSPAASLRSPGVLLHRALPSPARWVPRSPAQRLTGAAAARRGPTPTDVLSAPDGAGGLYIALTDFRDGASDIYLFRVTNAGTIAPGWPADGLAVCTAPGYQYTAVLFPDGANGVIVGWEDDRDGWYRFDAYAQRVTSAGTPLWTANGIKVLTGDQVMSASFALDGTGGAVFAWTAKGATDMDVFATRRDGSGAIASGWSAATPVCTAAGDQTNISVAGTGSGGAVVIWEDPRGATPQVYAQKLSGTGAVQWTADGIPVDDGTGYPTEPTAAPDGTGGAFVFWSDMMGVKGQHVNAAGSWDWVSAGVDLVGTSVYAGGTVALADGLGGAIVYFQNVYYPAYEVLAQRVNAAGSLQWGANGVQVMSPPSYSIDVVPDGAGGAMFAWEDDQLSAGSDVYAQRIGPTGAVQWTAGGVPVCTVAGDQFGVTAAPDGAGGLLVAWNDARTLGNDLYCQRLNSAGVPQFAVNGVAAHTDPGVQVGSITVADGAGGAFVVWNEKRSGSFDIRARHFDAAGAPAGPGIGVTVAAGAQLLESAVPDGSGGMLVAWIHEPNVQGQVFAQKFDASLAAQWTPGGVAVCTASGIRRDVGLVPDGAGGAFLAWMDGRGPTYPVTYAQRLGATGTPQWAADGIALGDGSHQQSSPAIVADGAGGAVVTWSDDRGGGTVYGQRVNSAGAAQWTAGGTLLASLVGYYGQVGAVSDGAGGAVAFANTSKYDPLTYLPAGERLIAQRVNAAGVPQWGDSGTVVCDAFAPIQFPVMATAAGGGAILAWSDGRSGPFDIRGQRLDGTGAAQWGAPGVVVCNAASWQSLSGIVPDGAGGAVLTWADERGGLADVYAQRMSSAGAAQWTANGVVVSAAAGGQFAPAPAGDGSGNTIVSWTDDRSAPTRFIYAQRLAGNGAATWTVDGIVPAQLSLASASADADGVHLRWWGPARVTATVYRRTASGPWTPLGSAVSDGSGLIAWHDREAAAGTRYGYRLGIVEADGETYAGEAWVDVPAGLALAIEGARPNPIRADFVVAFALGSSAPATLEVFDLSGRLVQRMGLAGLSAGRHVQRLEPPPGAGLYFLRLTQSGRSVTARTVVAP